MQNVVTYRKILDFKKNLVAIIWHYELHSGINVRKKFFAFSFQVTGSMKTRHLKPKYSFENLSPSPTLSYTITKKPKRVFCSTKVIEVPGAH